MQVKKQHLDPDMEWWKGLYWERNTSRLYIDTAYLAVLVSSSTQSCPTLSDPMDCSTPGFTVHHQLPKCTQTHVHWVGDAIQTSSSVVHFSCLQSFPASGCFPINRIFTSGGQSTGASASAPVISMNIQDLFPLGFTYLIFLQCKGLSRVLSNTIAQKHPLFGAQLSL